MMVKVFKFGNNNKVEFTQEELESLLNEVYNNGYKDGRNSKDYTWASPNRAYLNTPYCEDNKTNTPYDENIIFTGQMPSNDINSNISVTTTSFNTKKA